MFIRLKFNALNFEEIVAKMLLLFRKCNYNVEALLVLGILAAEGQYHKALYKRGVLLIRRLDKKSNSPV